MMEKVKPTDYFTKEQWECIKKEGDSHPTPNLVIDLAIVEQMYNELKKNFNYTKIYYAIKTYPNNEILKTLIKLGSNFDIASIYELDQILSLGVSPDKISYGNPIKKRSEIKYAYEKGCRLFSSDSIEDVKNIAKYAPGSDVFFRLLFHNPGNSVWPLTEKFGSENVILVELIHKAKELGLNPRGIAFHVGSQQTVLECWDNAIEKAAEVFRAVKDKYNIDLDLLNLGGGFPAHYLQKIPTSEEYGKKIKEYLDKHFKNNLPKNMIIEPGRGIVGDCATMTTSVVLISQKETVSEDKWLYIDAGVFNGFLDSLGEGVLYPIYSEASGELSKKFIIASNNCDSADVIYKKFRNPLPENIQIEDKIYWFHCGAYTSSCCFHYFNGFPPVPSYAINTNEILKK